MPKIFHVRQGLPNVIDTTRLEYLVNLDLTMRELCLIHNARRIDLEFLGVKMARTKNRWTGRLLKKGMFLEGGTLVVPARLDVDPDRIVEVHIQKSSVKALVEAMMKEAFPEPKPAGINNSGKHWADEEAF